jgi:hypothetical protein
MPIAKKEKLTPVKLKIGNVVIELGKKYVLDHMFDGSAPDGLKKIGATRLPFDNNTLIDCIEFLERKKLYDTGFIKNSECLKEYSPAELSELIPLYIKEPYEQINNVDLSASKDNEFYKDYRYELFVNKEFDTEDETDLFDLFNAILQGYVCLKDERNPFYRDRAQFVISNPTEFKNKEKDKVKQRMFTFEKLSLMCEDREKLDLVLEYIGKDNPSKIDSADLKMTYYKAINDEQTGMDFVERFTDASKKYETDQGKREMEYFAAVSRLHKAHKIKKDKRGFYTANGETFLGNTMQSVAQFCLNTGSEQNKIITELVGELD